jgi:hypothetical protein
MSGNRKHGFLRGNRGGFKPVPWFCDGCHKFHPGRRMRKGTLDGRSLCDRRYFRELALRDVAAQVRQGDLF